MVQWLGLRTVNPVGQGSPPGGGTKIPPAVQHGRKKKKKEILDEYLEEKSTRQNASYVNSIPTAATNGKHPRLTSFPEASIF